MIFQPTVPLPGIGGWQFLQRTEEAQKAVFDQSPLIARNIDYFTENIASATTAEALVNDRQLLEVALGAFGLQDEIDKKFFIQKILEEGTQDPAALAVRLVDPRYRQLSEAFGYGNVFGARVESFGFAREITDAYSVRQFEVAVGNSDNDLRLAMTFKREIAQYAASPNADDSAWFSVMGNLPLRQVFETGFSLPSEFGALDIDRQKDDLQDRMQDKFGTGSLAAFLESDNVDQMIRDFLVRSQIAQGPSQFTPGSTALTLLQSSSLGAIGSGNLLLSNAI